MALDPFVTLSSVGGPAVLANACSLFIPSTSNRFARAVDRSRYLVDALAEGKTGAWNDVFLKELGETGKRTRLIARAITSFYLAAAMFGLATLGSIAGAVLAQMNESIPLGLIGAVTGVCGMIGFLGFVTGAVALVAESRIALKSLTRESAVAMSLHKPGPLVAP